MEIGGPWPLLNLRPLHRNVIFATENHFSLGKWPPLFSVASSACDQDRLIIAEPGESTAMSNQSKLCKLMTKFVKLS